MAELYSDETGMLNVVESEDVASESEREERERIAAMQEMMATRGWKLFVADLETFYQSLVRELVTIEDESQVSKKRAKVRAFDDVLSYVRSVDSYKPKI